MKEKVVGTTFRQQVHPTKYAGFWSIEDDVEVLDGVAILRKEPTNPHDPTAVQVHGMLKGGASYWIGYLPKTSPIKDIMTDDTQLVRLRIEAYSNVMNASRTYNDSYQIIFDPEMTPAKLKDYFQGS